MVLTLTIALAVSAAAGDSYDEEFWNDPVKQHNKWTYWDTDYLGPGGEEKKDHHNPMVWFATDGVANSGYVRTPLGEMDPAFVHNAAAYWPAYPGDDVVTGFPDIDLSFPGAAISVFIKGSDSLLGQVGSFSLAGGDVRFFVGYWLDHDPDTSDDDEQAFYCTEGTFAVGDDVWERSTVILGGDDDWLMIVKENSTKTPTQLYSNPQQWGFVIWPVTLGDSPSGLLGFDNFRVIPEPGTLGLLALGGWAVCRRKRR